MTSEYAKQRNRERLAAQHVDVRIAAGAILQTFKDAENYLYWSMDPEEKDGGAYHCRQLLDYAHQLVDQAHAYCIALKLNPALKGEDDDQAA